jgi:hypothetical protein
MCPIKECMSTHYETLPLDKKRYCILFGTCLVVESVETLAKAFETLLIYKRFELGVCIVAPGGALYL